MSNTNAKAEFMGGRTFYQVLSEVKCATINIGYDYDDERPGVNLRVDYTIEDLERFLAQIDTNYNSGYGGQELYGTIWNNDGTWCTRGEYDGSEWWECHALPAVPEDLL